jgi:hypothetical protein
MVSVFAKVILAGQDWLVGCVAMVIGLILMAGATNIWPAVMQLAKTRWIQNRLGDRAGRIVVACLGLVLILLGIAIAQGFSLLGTP